jgi:membrane associated rhomboid family serine protease
MIPIGDDNSTRKTTPIVTYALILLNVFFFLIELSSGEIFVTNWAFIPSRFLANPASNFPTIFTSMFMHACIAHLVGNMLYLWIFGDNVEDRFGKVKYLLLYLICGVGATFSQLWFNPTSSIPNLGASGAIAGVLGAYIFQFPQEKVSVLFGASLIQLPALIVIGFWFLLQFFSGFSAQDQESGGVAYMAHIGGFIAGLLISILFTGFQRSVDK